MAGAPDVDAFEQDRSSGDVVEAHHETQQRGLAAAAGPDDGDALAGLRRDADAAQHLPVRVIAEVHVLTSQGHRAGLGMQSQPSVQCCTAMLLRRSTIWSRLYFRRTSYPAKRF